MSVVVTVTGHEAPFLAECLESLAGQSHTDVEIIVVPHGRLASKAAQAAGTAVREDGVQVLGERPATRGEARNLGAARATRTYLTFVSGADTLPRQGLLHLARSLDATGAQVARGHVVPGVGVAPTAVAQRPLEAAQRATIDTLPAALAELFAGGVMLRRDFWRTADLAFPATDGPVLDVGIAAALVRATAFDVVAAPVYRFQHRGLGRAVGAAEDPAAELSAWLDTQEQVGAALAAAGPSARTAWLAGVLGRDLEVLVDEVEILTDDQWQRLTDTVRDLAQGVGSDLWRLMGTEARVRAWLVAADRRAETEQFVDARRFDRGHFDTLVEDGTVYARLPFFRAPAGPVPDHVYALTEWETPLVASLRRARWNASSLDLELFVLIRGVATPDAPPEVRLTLVEGESGERRELEVEHGSDRDVTRFAEAKYRNHDHGLVRTTIDVPELVDDRAATWALEVGVRAHGVARTGTVHDRDPEGSASVPQVRTLGSVTVGLNAGQAEPVAVRIIPVAARLTEIAVAGRTVRGRIAGPSTGPATGIVAVRGDTTASGVVTGTEAGCTFELTLPAPTTESPDGPARPWRLRLLRGADRVPVAWPDGESSLWLGTGTDNEVAARHTPSGNAELVEVAGAAELLAAELGERSIVLRARWLGTPLPGGTLALVGSRCTLVGSPRPAGAGQIEVEVPLTWTEWVTETFVPLGTYRPMVTIGSGEPRPLYAALSLAQRFPEAQQSAAYRMRLTRVAGGRPAVRLHTPLADDEVGRHFQHVLRTDYRRATLPLDEKAVYLQSYTGHAATDSQVAIHEELRRSRPDLTLYWCVANAATQVPEGGVPVLMYSRRWYELLGSARHLVTNVDFERWFERRPGQRVLQTFHGYPSKSMGISMWRSKQFSRRKIEGELRRTSRDWDLILTPAPEMDAHYRTEYDYDGPILSHGYPRDDIFFSELADEVRERTRHALGIDGQTVVLYAPTWRDDLATRFGSSPLIQHLDLEQAALALGDDHVLLLRGHRYHQAAPRSGRGPRVIDVTTYPEINDLLLASDVAVLDYSSIRFDFALTGRPMIFLVPDLDQYTGGARGFLYPFEDSAPGPLVDTADQVVELLRDLDAVRRDHAEEYARFNATYNYRQDGRSAERVVRTFFS